MHTKLLLTASIALALAGNCFAAVKDGSYTTTVTGHNAPLTVTVDIKNGKISDISVKDLESPGVGKVAIKQLSAEIKDHQVQRQDDVVHVDKQPCHKDEGDDLSSGETETRQRIRTRDGQNEQERQAAHRKYNGIEEIRSHIRPFPGVYIVLIIKL